MGHDIHIEIISDNNQDFYDGAIIALKGLEKFAGCYSESLLDLAEKEKDIWMGYHALNASRTGQIHVLDPEIVCSPTPVSFAEALAYIVPLIHPELQGKEE